MSDPSPCVVPMCPALALPGADVCAVHAAYARRQPEDAPIHCYACGELIRVGRRWLVRVEGAFHVRPLCLMKSPEHYATKVL